MPITEFLERNAALYGSEKCLTEINLDFRRVIMSYGVSMNSSKTIRQGNIAEI